MQNNSLFFFTIIVIPRTLSSILKFCVCLYCVVLIVVSVDREWAAFLNNHLGMFKTVNLIADKQPAMGHVINIVPHTMCVFLWEKEKILVPWELTTFFNPISSFFLWLVAKNSSFAGWISGQIACMYAYVKLWPIVTCFFLSFWLLLFHL